jgi:hypothetical protein
MGVRGIVARLTAVLLGSVVGFFGSVNSVFADGGSTERVNAILLTALVVGLVSALVGVIDRGTGWRVAVWVWLPGAVMLVAYIMLGEYSVWMWAVLVAMVTFGAAIVGVLLGGMSGGRTRVR